MDYATRSLERLSKALKPATGNEEADAAVALLLRAVDGRLRILVVKRVENPSDPWSGQMALPGGRRELQDQDLKQTTVRETLEETGISLLDQCHFLGVLDKVASAVRPAMKIIPFVVLLEYEPRIRLNRSELEQFIWVSPEELKRHKGTAKFKFGNFPAYIIGNNVIWGLTYRILTMFTRLLRDT